MKLAHQTYESGVWSQASVLSRSDILWRLAQLLDDCVPELAKMETLQTGRAIREMNAQIARLPEWLSVLFFLQRIRVSAYQRFRCSRYFSAALRTHQGFIAPTHGNLLNYVHRVPLGVVAQITVSVWVWHSYYLSST